MAIDKGLYQAPTGIEDLAGPEIEIEVEDPESVRIGLGDIEIDLEPKRAYEEGDFDANLADLMDESALDRSEEHTSELQSHVRSRMPSSA